MTMPARIEVLNKVNRKTLLKVILKQRRNHQIHRKANLIVHPVQDLQKISIKYKLKWTTRSQMAGTTEKGMDSIY